MMNLTNRSKIIFTLLAMCAALVAFACQSTPSTNSGNTVTNAGPTNANTNAAANPNTAASTLNDPSKPPTMTDYPVGNAQSPSEAYRMLFAAVKSQDSAKIKSMLSKGSLDLASMWAGQQKKPVEEVLRNGLHETTMAEKMPNMRDERTKGNFAAVEVWNEQRKQWDDIPLVKEEDGWKVAYGDQFFGKWESPGKGQATIEREAANARNPNMIPVKPANMNVNVNVIPMGPNQKSAGPEKKQ